MVGADQLDAAPGAAQPLGADHRGVPEPHGDAVLLLQQRPDHLLLHLAVEGEAQLAALVVRRRGARSAGPARRAGRGRRTGAGRSRSSSGSTTVARLGRANSSATPAAPAPNPSPMRAASRPRSTTTWPAAASVTVSRPPRWNLRRPVTRAGSPRPRSSRSRTRSVPERSRATTSLPPASSRSILNTRPAAGPSGDGSRLGSSSGSACRSSRDPLALQGGPEQHGYVGIEPLADLELDELRVGAGPVDLVDEHHRGDAQPLQGAHQHQRLRLHALDRRDDQHGAVQQAQGALDLGDEVGVARGVDEVDGRAVDLEGHHRGADGDAPAPFERHRVGVGGAGVHAAGLREHACLDEQAFGQGRLAGVNMRQDPQGERAQPSHPWSGRRLGT